MASRNGYTEVVDVLIKAGADLNAQGKVSCVYAVVNTPRLTRWELRTISSLSELNYVAAYLLQYCLSGLYPPRFYAVGAAPVIDSVVSRVARRRSCWLLVGATSTSFVSCWRRVLTLIFRIV
jgi:hypothetical protein